MTTNEQSDSTVSADVKFQRILIVEDLEDSRESLRELLSHTLGAEVDTAADGEQALTKLNEQPYSLVITDLKMPKLNGMDLIDEIQRRKMSVSVIVSTAHGGVRDAVQATKKGVCDFLIKP